MKKEIQIGILAIITLAIVIWGYNFILGKNMFSQQNSYYGIFNDVTDLEASSEVMVNGLPVGTISSIELKPENVNEILVKVSIDRTIKLPADAKLLLKNASIMGGKFLELDFEKMCDGQGCAVDGQELETVELGMLGSLVNPNEMDPFVAKIGPSMDAVMSKLGEEGSDAPINKIILNMDETMENMGRITNSIDRILSKSQSNLDKTVSNLANISETLNVTNQKINLILDNFTTLSQNVKGVNLSETVGKTNQAIDNATGTLTQLKTTMESANDAVAQLADVVSKLDSDEGSLGKLMNDKALYDNFSSASRNLDLLLQDFRLNPKRYVNVSVFGKKNKSYELPENDPADKGN